MSGAYYNEWEKDKALWLRELIRRGLIADGEVDTRSIADVRPDELVGFTQLHWFAGVGAWSYALRLAGIPDDFPIWTASCPCPSFSVAGKGEGFDDPRHLWPELFRLVRERKPSMLFGEQADGAIGHGWFDLVGMDMESESYAVAAAVLPAASVGAPHRRNRLFFVANSKSAGREFESFSRPATRECDTPCAPEPLQRPGAHGSAFIGGPIPVHSQRGKINEHGCGGQWNSDPADSEAVEIVCSTGDSVLSDSDGRGAGRTSGEAVGYRGAAESTGGAGSMCNTCGEGLQKRLSDRRVSQCTMGPLAGETSFSTSEPSKLRHSRGPGWLPPEQARSVAKTGSTRGFWADCDWWHGRDGKYRPIGPGISPCVIGPAKPRVQPLADGTAESVGRMCDSGDACQETDPDNTSEARVIRLKGYGDAICAQAAAAFISASMDAMSVFT